MSKFEHSVPVPHSYKRAAKIVKEVTENRANLKSLVYSEKRFKEIPAIYALTRETLQHYQQIDDLLKRTKLLEKEPRFDPWLAKVLITELFWGKKRLPGESKPVKILLDYQQILNGHFNDICEAEQNKQEVIKPRYVRVNLLKTTVSKSIASFKEEGWIFIECDKKDYNEFLRKVGNLGKTEFMLDIHIEDLLIFPPGTKFYDHQAYLKGFIALQDKASCLPVEILNPPPHATVLDMCAAPGMKTSHLAVKMNNKGLIYAVDMNSERFAAMENLMNRLGVTCVKTINKNVLSLTEKDCPGVEYILIDPSCSGSGIVDRLDFDFQKTHTTEERLRKLAGFQILILKHALRHFPNVKKIVYCTCSINSKENEAVIQAVLKNCNYFKLVSARDALNTEWFNFGSPEFDGIGENCLYAIPQVDRTNGFFVAILERVTNNSEVIQQNASKTKRCKEFEASKVTDEKRIKAKANDIEEIKNDVAEVTIRKRQHWETGPLVKENPSKIQETEEQTPKKLIKINKRDEEMKNKQNYSQIISPIRELEQNTNAKEKSKLHFDKEENISGIWAVSAFQRINNLENPDKKEKNLKKLTAIIEENEETNKYENKKQEQEKSNVNIVNDKVNEIKKQIQEKNVEHESKDTNPQVESNKQIMTTAEIGKIKSGKRMMTMDSPLVKRMKLENEDKNLVHETEDQKWKQNKIKVIITKRK